MDLDLRESGDVSILVLSGRLTTGTDVQLREAVDTLLGSNRTKILLDLSEVGYVDSAGIGELVASYRTVARFGGELKILRPSEKVHDSLSLTRLLPIFEIFDDEATAVSSFGANA